MKYKNVDLDGIITTDDNALQFVLKNRAQFKGEVPITFCGINFINEMPLKGEKNIAGYVEVLDIKETIDLALNLHPETKNIVVVVDNTTTGKGQREEIAQVESQIPELKFKYIGGDKYSTKEMLNELRALSSDTIVLLAVWLRDKNEEYVSAEEGGKAISLASKVPVYGIIDMYLNNGIVGGKILSSRDHGREAAEHLVQNLKEGFDPEDNPIHKNSINRFMFDYMQLKRWEIKLSRLPKGSIITNRPFSVYKKYKHIIWVDLLMLIAQFLLIMALVINISRRKRAEKELNLREDHYAKFFNNALVGLFRTRLSDGLFIEINDKASKYIGRKAEEIVGKMRTIDLYRKFSQRKELVSILEKEGEVTDFEVDFKLDGREVTCSLTAKAYKDKDLIEGVVIDITDRKKAEEELRKEKESVQRYLDIVNTIIIALDKAGNIILVNNRGLEILGYKEDELIGRNWFEICLPSNIRDKVRSVFEKILDGIVAPVELYENLILNKNGEEILVAWHNSIIQNSDGSINGILSSGEDISERKKYEISLMAQKKYFESMDQINNCIQNSENVNELIDRVLEKCISIFESDRTWLLYPCDINAPYWSVPMERTREGFSGAFSSGIKIPTSPEAIEVFQDALNSEFPIAYDSYTRRPLPVEAAKQFNIKAQITFAIHTKKGKPWLFGMHQCSYDRVWTLEDNRLFMEIGRRVEDGLSSLMFLNDLSDSEEKYRLLFDNPGVLVSVFDRAGHCVLMNQSLADNFVGESEGFIGKSISDLYPESADKYMKRIQDAIDSKESIKYEEDVIFPVGRRSLISYVHPVVDSNGIVISAQIISQDITSRKKAEDDLKDRELQLRLIMENMGDMISQHLPDSTITYVSASCMNLLGYRFGELINKHYNELIHSEDIQHATNVINSALQNKDENFREQYRLRHKKGNFIWVDTLGKLVFAADGSLREIQCSVRDITEKKMFEEELKKSERLMKQSVEGMLEGYALHEAIFNENGRMIDYRFLEFNPAAQEISNVRREDIVGKTALELYPHIVENGLMDKYADVMETGEASYIEDYFYYGDNMDKGLDISCFPIDNKHFVCVFRDVTEKMKVKEALIREKEKAERINEAKSEFLMNVSHDIRTPMNVISGFNELLMKTNLNEDQKKFCGMIKKKGKDLINLIEDILDISFVEKGKVRIHQSPLSLSEIFEDVRQSVQILLGDSEVVFKYDIGKDIPKRVLGDSMRLKQVLENLCGNAVKYTKKGNINLIARIEDGNIEDQYHFIRFDIEDTGIGISKDNIDHIFEPYTRFHEIGEKEYRSGVGMGLHIVHILVREMGGKVTVRSEVDKGSKFSFVLKMKEPPMPVADIKTEISDKPEADVSLAGINILVAEDDESTRALMERSFRDTECTIKFACDGEEVLEEMKKNKYDLVLMDLRMPRIDGFEATKIIREEIDKDIPILALTAHKMIFIEDDCKRAGMNGYISKPVDIDKLKRAIKDYI
ncbi:MAG: PAS domain S-box protein [Candidatus Omnitrophica bacterium]|nr:PAS domain S-box protein [Candidatus Omnitrophota bacterium]MBU1996049.1 PAS domain S-box protein [Candidatus Omnitrophota bacterium]